MYKSRLLPLPVLILSALNAYAANTQNPLDQIDKNVPNQFDKDFRDNLDQIHSVEIQKREQSAWDLQKKQDNDTVAQEVPSENNTECLDYTGIELSGITLIDSKKIEAKLPKCINQNNINQLNRDIVAEYIAQGYPHTQIKFETTPERILKLAVIEGKIREITGGSRTVNVDTLFPNHQGKPLNIQYLDQGIEQANHVAGNNVSIDVYPHDDGTASIQLNNNAEKHWGGSVTIDNKGSKPNTTTLRGSLNIGSPLGLSDSLYLNGYTNLNNHDSHYSRGGSLFYQVPYGAWTFSTYAAASQSQSILTPSVTRYAYRSQSKAAGIKADRVFSRSQKHITSAYAGIDYVKQTAKFADSKLELQSPEIYSAQVGLSHIAILPNGIWLNNIGVEQGFAKNSEHTPFDKRYTSVSLQSNLIQNRPLGKWIVRNHHQIDAQYSPHDLFATKEMDIVGYQNVRGFRSTSLSANSAVLLSNTVYFRRNTPHGIYIEPYLGADIGVAKNNNEGSQRAIGVVAGLNLGKADKWQLSADYGKGFARMPNQSNSEIQDHVTISLRIPF